jgi:hypothetical protein
VPLDSYGLLVGVLVRSFRDRPDDQGRWFHVNLEVDAPDGRFDVFLSKFSSQAARTDADGHPAVPA